MSAEINKIFAFQCAECNTTIKTDITKIGATLTCECGVNNRVPLPRVKIKEEMPGTLKRPKTGEKTKPGHNSSQEPLENSIHQPPTTNKYRATEPLKTEPEKKDANDPLPKNKQHKSIIYIAAFIFGIVIVTVLKNGLFGPLSSPNHVISNVNSNMVVDVNSVRELLSFQKAALLAKESIELDLAVSLAEMESRGMVDQARIVEAAIIKKEQSIEKSRQRFHATLQELLNIYDASPRETLSLFHQVTNQPDIRNDPRSLAFLNQLKNIVEKHGDDKSIALEQANNFFGLDSDNSSLL